MRTPSFFYALRWAPALALTWLIGCGSPQESNQESESMETSAPEEVTQQEPVNFSIIIEEVPAPTQLPTLLMRSGVEFTPGLTNPDEKVQDYMLTNDVAALNLGVYSTDLGYLCAYEKAEEAIDYFKACQELGEKLEITGAFEASLLERFEQNLANKDSLIALVNRSSDLIKTFLDENEQYNTAAMIVTGSFIEGLYLSTQLIENYPKELDAVKDQVLVDLVRTTAEQKQPLGDIIRILEPIESTDKQAKNLLGGLRPLYDQFEAMNLEEKIAQNEGELQLKTEDLSEVSAMVENIRGKIVD